MKKFFLLLLLSSLSVFASLPPRRIDIGTPIGCLNRFNTEIIITSDAPKTTQFAGQELQKYLSAILGETIPVNPHPSSDKISFILGHNRYSSSLEADTSTPESYIIHNTATRIYILGKDDPKADPLDNGIGNYHNRNTLFGVYDWLERFAGVRFYFLGKDGTILPSCPELSYPEAYIFERPDYSHRSWAILGSEPGGGKNERKIASGRAVLPRTAFRTFNSLTWRRETHLVPNCHGQTFLGYMTRFEKQHPEYFAMDANGKRHNAATFRPHLCYSSNAREELYQDMVSYFKGEPAEKRGVIFRGKHQWYHKMFRPGYFNIMPDDSFKKCHCPLCMKKWTSDLQYASEFIWEFVAECGNRLKQEKIPGIITMMAYYPYRSVPKVKIPDNVAVMVAETGPWGKNNTRQQELDNAEIRAWAEKIAPQKIWLWVYLCKFGAAAFPNIPSPTPQATGDYFKNLGNIIDGAYLEAETDRSINNYLTLYIFSKLAWNNNLDVQKLITEHHQLMFGAGAEEMGKIYQRSEELWLNKIVGRITFNELGPIVSPPSENELWNSIYTSRELKLMESRFNKAEKMAAKDPDALRRIRLYRNEWLIPLQQEQKKYCLRVDSRGDQKIHPEQSVFLHAFQPAGAPTDVRTEIKFKRNNGKFIFEINAEEPEMTQMESIMRQSDDPNIWKDSCVEIFINPSGDLKNIYQLIINLQGCLSDQKTIIDGTKSIQSDWSWNSHAVILRQQTKQGYQMTVSIPENCLPELDKKIFPVNFCRTRKFKNIPKSKLYTWGNHIRRFNDIENFGLLSLLPSVDKNLVDNSNFTVPSSQKGKAYGQWYGKNPRNFTEKSLHCLDRSTFVSGGQSIKLTADGTNIELTQFLKTPLKTETKYRLSYYVRLHQIIPSHPHSGVYVQVQHTSKDGFPKNPMTGTTDWLKQSFEFKTGSKIIHKPHVMLRILQASGTAWFDNISLEEI